MAYSSVLVAGGTGFIGGHLVARLAETGVAIIVPTRHAERARHLLVLPGVDVVEANVNDEATLDRLLKNVDAVINLVGVLHSAAGPAGSPYGPGFAHAHVALPRKIVAACGANKVRRYLHMSALGADSKGPSMYSRSKADGELAAKSDPALAVTIFRPSVVFGEDDHFLNLFAHLQRILPVILLGGANAKLQPVYVKDVALAYVNALENPAAIGKTYEIAGPEVYTLRELVRLAGIYSGHPRPIIGLPEPLARFMALLMEHMPGRPLMSRDNLASLKVDNVASGPIDPALLPKPTPLEAIAPFCLRPRTGGVEEVVINPPTVL